MSSDHPRIGLIPIGEIPAIIPKIITAHLLGYLQLTADILSPMAHPAYALNERRLQYDAGIILKEMESRSPHPFTKLIGVVDLDIFVPIFTHVYGEAKQGGRHALVSTYRLKRNRDGSTPPRPLFLERAAKVALHELGHLFEMGHCTDERCLMHFSGNLESLDKTPLFFCRYCAIYLRDTLLRPPRPGG
jgi:archaemetzincin